jgi:hypothetical protein
MKKSPQQKYLELALDCLEHKRKEYVANASVEKIIFDFQTRAKEHYAEYTEAIEYIKELIEENKNGINSIR